METKNYYYCNGTEKNKVCLVGACKFNVGTKLAHAPEAYQEAVKDCPNDNYYITYHAGEVKTMLTFEDESTKIIDGVVSIVDGCILDFSLRM